MQTHLVLFLKNSQEIDLSDLVAEIEKRYIDLGKGFVFNKDSEENVSFIFNTNQELIVEGNKHHFAFHFFNDYEKIKMDIINILWDAFDLLGVEFNRIGYIKEFIETNEIIDRFKNDNFISNDVKVAKEFEFGYHCFINYKKNKMNCWKRYSNHSNKKFVISYDINTSTKNDEELKYKFIKDFLEFSDNYILNEHAKLKDE